MSELQDIPMHSVLRQLEASPGKNTSIRVKKKNQIEITDLQTGTSRVIRRIQLARAVFDFAEKYKRKRFGRRASLARAIEQRDWLEFLNLSDAVLLREIMQIALDNDTTKKGRAR